MKVVCGSIKIISIYNNLYIRMKFSFPEKEKPEVSLGKPPGMSLLCPLARGQERLLSWDPCRTTELPGHVLKPNHLKIFSYMPKLKMTKNSMQNIDWSTDQKKEFTFSSLLRNLTFGHTETIQGHKTFKQRNIQLDLKPVLLSLLKFEIVLYKQYKLN